MSPTPRQLLYGGQHTGQIFLPWTVTRTAWTAVLRPGVSGIAMDVMLFHQHSARLVHRYSVYADPLPHRSIRGPFMLRLARFTLQTSVEARSAATRDWDSGSESAPTLLRQAHRIPDSGVCTRCSHGHANVSADAPALVRAAPADGPVSPGILRPIRRLSQTLTFRCPRRGVLMSRCSRVLNPSICQCRRSCYFPRFLCC